MSKISNPLSIYALLKRYHKKHYKKFVVPALVIVVIGTILTVISINNNSLEFEWFEYLKDVFKIFALFYTIYLFIFILYYRAFTHPYKFQLLFNQKATKILFIFLFVAPGLPLIIRDYMLTIVELEEIIKLSWGIFAVSVTFALVTFFFVSEKLKSNKDNISLFDKPLHNTMVFLSLSTFFLLAFNVFFLSWSTIMVFVTSRESGGFEQTLTKISIWLSLNVVVFATFDFISLIKEKQRELSFQNAEVMIEIKERKKKSSEFQELRSILKNVNMSFKVAAKKKKKLEIVLTKLERISSSLTNIDEKKVKNNVNYFEKRRFLKTIKEYGKLLNKMYQLYNDMKGYEEKLKEMSN